MRYCWAATLATSVLLSTNPAAARDAAASIAIPPGNLTDALASLAAQTGVSFGYDATLPTLRVRGVNGRMFGAPPSRDAERLRGVDLQQMSAA